MLALLFNMKCGVKDSLTQEVIDEEMSNLRDLNKRDWYTEAFQITKKIEWSYERQPVSKKEAKQEYAGRGNAFTGISTSISKLPKKSLRVF